MTWMQFGTDPGQIYKVRWYFCEPTALDLGFPTPFTSRDWDQWEVWPDIGEVQYAPRHYDNFVMPVPVAGTGKPCGDPEVWAKGYQGHIPPDFPRNMFGVAACCGGFIAPLGEPTFGLNMQIQPSVTPITVPISAIETVKDEQQEAMAMAASLARKAIYPMGHVGKIMEEYDLESCDSQDGLIFGER